MKSTLNTPTLGIGIGLVLIIITLAINAYLIVVRSKVQKQVGVPHVYSTQVLDKEFQPNGIFDQANSLPAAHPDLVKPPEVAKGQIGKSNLFQSE